MEFLNESLKDKFKRLVVDNPTPSCANKKNYASVVDKISKMSLQELHEKVQEISKNLT